MVLPIHFIRIDACCLVRCASREMMSISDRRWMRNIEREKENFFLSRVVIVTREMAFTFEDVQCSTVSIVCFMSVCALYA